MFQIKTFLGLIASMVNRLRLTSSVLTDFNIGSNIRVLLEAVAQEIDELYQQMVAALQAAIAQATYLSFGFSALPAVSASGPITVTVTAQAAAFTIGLGAVFTPIGAAASTVVYTATAQVTIAAGATQATVPVIASQAGTAGNLPVNTSFTMGSVPPGFVSAINGLAFNNAIDLETPNQQYIRFQAYIVSLARSTLAGVTYGALSTILYDTNGNVLERVVQALPFEPYSVDTSASPSLYYLYIYNGVGVAPAASAALVTLVQSTINGSYDPTSGLPIDGYKAAGTVCVVQAATLDFLAITATLKVTQNTVMATAQTAVESAWTAYLARLPIGAGSVLASLYAAAMSVTGVTDCVITAPAADVAGAVGVVLIGGTFTVTTTGGQ